MEDNKIIEERTKKFLNYLKNNYNWVVYVILAFIVFIAVKIRTLNISGLKDITTGGWTLGPDLDPFLFLRWAKEIIAHGSLPLIDYMRNVPLGFPTREEVLLHPYLIAYFHKFASALGFSSSVDYSAIIYPVVVFALSVIFFFLFVRKLLVDSIGHREASIVALLSSLFFSILPSILPRTIAGIPEKEASGFLFLFVAFYFFLTAWKAKKLPSRLILGFVAGAATAAMALVWGGYIYIFLTIGIALIFAFLLGQIDKNKLYLTVVWLASSAILMNLYSTRYTFVNLISSTTTLAPFAIVAILVVHFAIFNTRLKDYVKKIPYVENLPKPVFSIIATIIIGIVLATIFFGPHFIIDKVSDVSRVLITPVEDRLGVTVAENRQPYFMEWAGNFGPSMLDFFNFITLNQINFSGSFANFLSSLPILFWLFFAGSIFMYSKMMKIFTSSRERVISTIGYTIFLFAIVFSRLSSTSTLNGTNGASILLYIVGVISLVGTFGYYYYQHHKKGEEEKFSNLDFGLIMLFAFFFFSLISARGAVRLIMVLVPPVAILVSYFIVVSFNDLTNFGKTKSWGRWTIAAILIILTAFSAYAQYSASSQMAQSYVPSGYNQQWQKAMAWVREDTPQNAVFGHWWDYGYWVQSIGDRATVLDGGNALPYWNHMMGRYALTGPDNQQALEFLYAHNTTHFLIDSTDIGKYGAFSSIGSDQNYDRSSWISSFVLNPQYVQEKKNATTFVYTGGTYLDEDIRYNINGTDLLLATSRTVLVAIQMDMDQSGNLIGQPSGIFQSNGNNYIIPFRYAFDGKFRDFGSGIDSGVFLFPKIETSSDGTRISGITKNGALLYLSNRTVNSQLARLYLYGEDNGGTFKLAHDEDDPLVAQIKSGMNSNSSIGDFVYLSGFRGPIKIWEIDYPSNIKIDQQYLNTDYPTNIQRAQ